MILGIRNIWSAVESKMLKVFLSDKGFGLLWSYFDCSADIFLDHVGIYVSHVIFYNALVEILDRLQNSTEETSILDICRIESKEIVLARLYEFLLCLITLFMFLWTKFLPRWLYP